LLPPVSGSVPDGRPKTQDAIFFLKKNGGPDGGIASGRAGARRLVMHLTDVSIRFFSPPLHVPLGHCFVRPLEFFCYLGLHLGRPRQRRVAGVGFLERNFCAHRAGLLFSLYSRQRCVELRHECVSRCQYEGNAQHDACHVGRPGQRRPRARANTS
jgi:hypothetical protein